MSETELGVKQKILSKNNQDEITRLDELKLLWEARAGEKESIISCLRENIRSLEAVNEDVNTQVLEQKDEKSELTVKLKTEIDSDNKLKILSTLNQNEIIRSNESGVVSNAKEGEKEGTVSCLKDDKNHLKHRKNCKIEDRDLFVQ